MLALARLMVSFVFKPRQEVLRFIKVIRKYHEKRLVALMDCCLVTETSAISSTLKTTWSCHCTHITFHQPALDSSVREHPKDCTSGVLMGATGQGVYKQRYSHLPTWSHCTTEAFRNSSAHQCHWGRWKDEKFGCFRRRLMIIISLDFTL